MQLTFDHVHKNGPRVSTFYFKPEHKLRYDAGQFVELSLPHDGSDDRGTKRWFTLSSSPLSDLISITTRLAGRPSSFKRRLQALQPGDHLHVSESLGDFVLPKDATLPLVFVAGGIGITPFLSIARSLTDRHEIRRIRLHYVVHAINDALFKEELLNAGYKVNIILSKQKTGPLLTDLEQGPDCLYYISGPEGLAEKMTAELTASGVAESQIVTDYFPGY
jgi:ferredoxin-NADP reductase